ncbi:hypothetical protein INR49_010055 [Caranx melampygus]|nr:hypothetical protein INR49_010055 [Caranx melampygus]
MRPAGPPQPPAASCDLSRAVRSWSQTRQRKEGVSAAMQKVEGRVTQSTSLLQGPQRSGSPATGIMAPGERPGGGLQRPGCSAQRQSHPAGGETRPDDLPTTPELLPSGPARRERSLSPPPTSPTMSPEVRLTCFTSHSPLSQTAAAASHTHVEHLQFTECEGSWTCPFSHSSFSHQQMFTDVYHEQLSP